MPMAAASRGTSASCAPPSGRPPVSSQHTLNAARTHSSAARVTVTLGGQVRLPPVRRAAMGAPIITPTEYPASATPLWTARADRPTPAAIPSKTRFPVITLPKTLPRARNEAASTAPVVAVSSTTNASRAVTCQRSMADATG
jgi:hypothetical protein